MAPWRFLLLILIFVSGSDAAIFTLSNSCRTTIWPGILSGAGKPLLMDGGCVLKPGQSVNINAPRGWSGRFWARTGCSFDPSGRGKCLTGDCSGALKCAGAGGTPPASLAEFTLNTPLDYYDISLVDGFNIPISIFPTGGGCKATQCRSYINRRCPSSLQLKLYGKVVACKSACLAFQRPQYCCTGDYGSPHTCKPTNYSKVFKAACPTAYSYAYDDPSSTFTCQGVNFLIRFC